MILDGCREFSSDEPTLDGAKRKHALNTPKAQMTKALQDYVVAHACGPGDRASDSSECTTDNSRTALAVV